MLYCGVFLVTLLKARRSDVHDKERSGRPSVVTDELIQKHEEKINADKCLTINGFHEQCPQVSRTVLYETVTERLGYWKLCTRWVLKMPTDNHKKNRVVAAQAFLACYENHGDEFLDYTMMGDENAGVSPYT